MAVRIVEETTASLAAYSRIPMTVDVKSVFRVEAIDGRFELFEEPVLTPWVKDYDAAVEDRPVNLPSRNDLSDWAVLAAYEGDERIGGAIVASGDDAWFTNQGASLVDIRVAPAYQRHGVGEALFSAVVAWARQRGCTELVIETQNVNVPACRFYEAMGCILVAATPDAYPHLPGEVRLIWRLGL